MLNFQIKLDSKTKQKYMETPLYGKQLLTTTQLNKGTAFTIKEREAFNLLGKLPVQVESVTEQADRTYQQYQNYLTPLQKNIFLNQLHDTNLVLFYRLVIDHIEEMIPILYTPTVGTAVEKFSHEFQQARGLYISYENRDMIYTILDNRSNPEVDLVVVTDGGRVLGIGDQGVGAMLIPVAKLMVYGVCGGINPYHTLPIMLDVGTDNEALRNDRFYLGWRHPRIRGKEYQEFIAKFIAAFKRKFPHTLLHWEDFGRENAYWILNSYQNQVCTFNDDIQGTGAVTCAALSAAITITQSNFAEQRIVMFGAGSAGMGIADQICTAMTHFGLSIAAARQCFWFVDRFGLLTKDSKDLTPAQQPFVQARAELNGASLLEVIQQVKPTILIGCSAQAGAFSKEIITAMAKGVQQPIIFPLSNPTEKAEATPKDLLAWTNGKALIATGSPFANTAQCNNALIFPGLGLGSIAVGATRITENMIFAASQTLAAEAPIHKNKNAPILPSLKDSRAVAYKIALAVAKEACKDGVASADKSTLAQLVTDKIWKPEYLPFRKPS